VRVCCVCLAIVGRRSGNPSSHAHVNSVLCKVCPDGGEISEQGWLSYMQQDLVINTSKQTLGACQSWACHGLVKVASVNFSV
jgi:hypothetical protein